MYLLITETYNTSSEQRAIDNFYKVEILIMNNRNSSLISSYSSDKFIYV